MNITKLIQINFHLIDLNYSISNHTRLSFPLLTQFIFSFPQTPTKYSIPYFLFKTPEISSTKYPPNLYEPLYQTLTPKIISKNTPSHLSSSPQWPAESQSSWTPQKSWPLPTNSASDPRILPIFSPANYPTSLLCLKNSPLVSFNVNIKALCWTPGGLVSPTCAWGLESWSLIVVASPFGL